MRPARCDEEYVGWVTVFAVGIGVWKEREGAVDLFTNVTSWNYDPYSII